MSLLGKTRTGSERAAAPAPAPSAPGGVLRVSNALKDFLWLLSDVERGQLLDLGPVSQATVSFFTSRGFKVYAEDLLRSWQQHLRQEEARLRSAPAGSKMDLDHAALAENFLAENLAHPPGTFHAVLAWDLLDYLDSELLPRVVARLFEVLQPNGLVLGVFHSRTPESFHRYRVADEQHIELVPAPGIFPPQRSLQNREILNLFSRFRTSKTFVGRDQLREALITR
jgi:hypothetical protein